MIPARLPLAIFHPQWKGGADVTLEQIIRALGGNAAVAKWCGCEVSAVSNWKTRGLPKGRQVDLMAMAKNRRIPLTLEQLAAADAMRGRIGRCRRGCAA